MSQAIFRLCAALFFTALIATGVQAQSDDDEFLDDDERVCVSQFALCTSAPCIPDPLNPTEQALCTCEVAYGPNYAAKTECKHRGHKPIRLPGGLVSVAQVVSTYAFIQAPTKPVMTCETNAPWTDCLDALCIVDPENPLKALCSCPYADPMTETFVTYGGSCNTNTCESVIWSAATVQAFQAGSDALIQATRPEKKPYEFCPPQELVTQ